MAEIVVRTVSNPVAKVGAYKRGDLVRAYDDGTVTDVWSATRPDRIVKVPGMSTADAAAQCAEVYSVPAVLAPSRLLLRSVCYIADMAALRDTMTAAEFRAVLVAH